MDWNTIISGERTGVRNQITDNRTHYQRDFDRIIFSSAFRRLQNKTQIFPLPGATFVHNRLTHSLEVASVGRSLGKQVGESLIGAHLIAEHQKEFYRYELQNVIASACLAHDIGNPSFGHSGEEAISTFFRDNASMNIEGRPLKDLFNEKQWTDFKNFEGNANSFRILTHQFAGKAEGGYNLTLTTLAAILKYPCESIDISKKEISTKKFSFFQAEKELGHSLLDKLNVGKIEGTQIYKRHPFVFLTEAADDICYRIVDFEDAQRLKILSHEMVRDYFIKLITSYSPDINAVLKTLKRIEDKNEQIAYLRAKSINTLTNRATELFIERADAILNGKYKQGLLDELTDENSVLKDIQTISFDSIYNHKTVLELEITGFKIMDSLLNLFVPAILKTQLNFKDDKALKLIPTQYRIETDDPYQKVLSMLDFLSGMTDPYALELYRKLIGIEVPIHK